MDYGHDHRMRMSLEGDRLSSLPDDLIHKILSFIGIKQVTQTCVLSSRWRFIWTSMPNLNFSSDEFSKLPIFVKFVTYVLSNRNNQIDVSSLKLSFRGKASQVFVKKILHYAFSHNVQQMTITCLLKDDIEFPLSLFSSQSLKHLTLIGSTNHDYHSIMPTLTWELPALTTLHLDHVTLYDYYTDSCISLFSKCVNLQNLTLSCWCIRGSGSFTICHPQLSNLNLDIGDWSSSVVNLVAPQLKYLTITDCNGELLISAPELIALVYKSHHSLQFSTESLPSLEKLELCIQKPDKEHAHKIVGVLQQVLSVQFLTLSLEIMEVLSSSLELIPHQPSPFANLRSLKVYPENENAENKVNMSTKVKNYLLDSSPSATFTMVSREDVRAMKNATLARNLMAELRVLLDQEKLAMTNTTNMQQGKAPADKQKAQPVTKRSLPVEGRTTQIRSCWEDLTVRVQNLGRKCLETCGMVSKLQRIEGLLIELPASKRDEMQACFSSLCIEAETVMNKLVDRMEILIDAKRTRLNVYFRELAKTSQPSSSTLFSRP